IAAGRIAVPLDARDPLFRLAAIHEHAEATLTVGQRASVDVARSVARDGRLLVVVDTEDADRAAVFASTPSIDPTSIGMVVFTSGSTGSPKGVVLSNDALVDNALRMGYAQGLTPDDAVAVPGSLAFGASHSRIFAGLVAGARVCLYDLRERGPGAIPEWANAHRVTWMFFVPSVLRAVIDHAGPARMDTVRLVTYGGEPLYGRDVRGARALFAPGTVFRNRLSSSETTGVTGHVVTEEDERADGVIAVGTLEPWVEAHVVDDEGRPVASGAPGRLVVIGDKLAAGYWKDPALTAERFFDLPDGRRGFRTSDVVRWRDDGVLEHVGRSDDLVRVRGAMASPTEVERALAQHEGVAAGAVKAFPSDDGGMRLVAYVAPAEGTTLSASSIRRALASSVPAHMVPGTVVMLDALPIGARGKIDRERLEEPVAARPYREPQGNERDLAQIFADVLGVDRVGLDDDFFELGGDSLSVVELLAGVADRFSVDIPASTVLDAPTVAELALRLSHRRPRDASPVVPLRTGTSGMPFFCMTGGGAPAISLRALSDAITGYDFYAVQPRGLEERALPDRTVADAARRNLIALRGVQPQGPYALGGYSFGGLVAFEMACRLRGVGEEVVLLVILDRTAPLGVPSVANRMLARADALRVGTPVGRLRRAATVAARAATFCVASGYRHAERRITLTSAGLIPRRGYHQYDVFLRLNARMSREYKPSTTFDGPVLVVRGSTSIGRPPNVVVDPDLDAVARDRRLMHDLGWSKLVSGPLSVIEIPGDHFDVMRQPAVEQVAAHVNTALVNAWHAAAR
ncbi:MAG TPA: AMP-binding protein, partial [Acidimicrobiia bacterium]|nr:AMP-binding protein [Acidimicrobiia bacterium]